MLCPLVDSQTRRNHSRAEITRFLFGQPLRTAKALGLDVPLSFYWRADEAIE